MAQSHSARRSQSTNWWNAAMPIPDGQTMSNPSTPLTCPTSQVKTLRKLKPQVSQSTTARPDRRTQTWAVLLCALTLNQRQIATSGWFWCMWICWLVWSYVDVQFYPHVFMAISPPVVQWVIAIAKQQLNHTLKAVSRQCWVVKWANQSQSILVMFNSLHDLNIESL